MEPCLLFQRQAYCIVLDYLGLKMFFLHNVRFFRVVFKNLQEISLAIEKLHRNNYVHMDPTANNLFISSQGNWLLGDFGSMVQVYNTPEYSFLFESYYSISLFRLGRRSFPVPFSTCVT